MIKSIGIRPKVFLQAKLFSPLDELSSYENGELLSIMVIGKVVIYTPISKNNKPNTEAKKIPDQ